MNNFKEFIDKQLKPFETSKEESIAIRVDDRPCMLHRCDIDNYWSFFSPKVVESVDGYHLVIDEIAEDDEFADDCYIETPSCELYYLIYVTL